MTSRPTIRLVRHGQASWGAADYDQLSELGREQAATLGHQWKLSGTTPGTVLAGSMRRHAQTAAACLGDAQELVLDDGWNEFDHVAVHRAFSPDTHSHSDPKVASALTLRWIQGEGEHEENYVQFVERVRAVLARTVARAREDGVVTVFSSGGPISIAASLVLVGDDSLFVPLKDVLVNASVTEIAIPSTAPPTLTSFNEALHLERGERTRY